jgi:hypothetical protein
MNKFRVKFDDIQLVDSDASIPEATKNHKPTYHGLFETYEEAKQFIIKRHQREIDKLELQLHAEKFYLRKFLEKHGGDI